MCSSNVKFGGGCFSVLVKSSYPENFSSGSGVFVEKKKE